MATIDDRFYDSLEVRDAAHRDQALLTALPGLLRHAIENAPAMADHLAGGDPDSLNSFAALAELPILHKSELIERQRSLPPR
jgi:phenylacetate-CoA ligase